MRLIVKSKKRKLLRTSAIPNLFTFANACFGFFAIIYVLDGNVYLAACTLLLSIAADMLDGLCARRWHASSVIGAELDSLADAVSFCLAPAILTYRLSPHADLFLLASLSAYICSGIFRLARFTTQQKKPSYFIGLPSPAAAFIIINLILYQQWFMHHCSMILTPAGLSAIILLLSVLMISTVPFPSWKTYSLKSKYVVLYIVLILALSLIGAVNKIPIFLLFAVAYISAGCLLHGLVIAKRLLTSVV